MEDSTLYYYKSQDRAMEVKKGGETHTDACDGIIPLDIITSVQTAVRL